MSPVASTFGGESHEALERHLLVGNDRVTDQRFVGPRFLTARLATQPLLNESRAQRAVRRVRPAKTKQRRADGIVLVSGHQFLFVIWVRASFDAGEETRSYNGGLRA